MFQKHSRHYTAHRKLKHDFDMEPSHTCPSLPASAVPVDVTVYAHTWKVHSHYVQWDLPASSPSSSDIQNLAPILAEWEQPLLEGHTLQVSIAELLEELQSPIRVASDGSVNEHRSSFGWVLHCARDDPNLH